MQQILQAEPARPRTRVSEIPLDLETIVLKAMAKDARDRYSSPDELADDLRRFLADRPIHARRPALWERTRRLCRRNPLVASLIVSVALLLVLGVIISFAYSVRLTGELAKTERAEEGERNAKQDALEKLWQSYLEQAKAQQSSHRIGQRFEGLRAVQDAQALVLQIGLSRRHLDSLRNVAIASLALPDLRKIREWEQWPADVGRSDFDERGERYARSEAPGTVTIRRVADDSEIAQFTGLGTNLWPRLTPDGRCIAISSDTGFKVWNLDGPRFTEVLDLPDVSMSGFSRDSRRVAVAFKDGKLELNDLQTSLPVRSLGTVLAPSWPLFNPNGQYLAVQSGEIIHIVDVDSGTRVRELRPPGTEFEFAWCADSKSLAIGVHPEGVLLWNVVTGTKAKPLPHRGGGVRVACNTTGDLLLSYSWWDGDLSLWNPQTGQLHLGGYWGVQSLATRSPPDGRLLLLALRQQRVTLWEVNPGPAYRSVARDVTSFSEYLSDCALSPDSRLLVASSQRGLTLWDLATGTQLDTIQIAGDAAAFDRSGQLLTNGPSGLLRWPIGNIIDSDAEHLAPRADGQPIEGKSAAPGDSGFQRIQIGPPQRTAAMPRSRYKRFGMSRDGQVVGVALGDGACVVHMDRPEQPILLGPHVDVRFVSVSPDGQYIATGSWIEGAKVWDASTGKIVKDLPVGISCQVVFSPDGRWLGTSSEGGQLWRVGTWEKGASLGGIGTSASGLVLAFSPLLPRPDSTPPAGSGQLLEGSILAMTQCNGVIRLIDPETGRTIAELAVPHQHRAHSMSFNFDGSKLLSTIQEERGMVHIWDLRLLRAELTALDLDWDWPALPASESHDKLRPLAVQVNLGSELSTVLTPEQTAQRSIDGFRAAHVANSNDAAVCNGLAWTLATAPEKLRRVDEALPFAEKAVQLTPGNALYANTLGVVYYRLGRFREAVDCLEANLSKQEDFGLPFDLYFLAMSYHQLGDSQRARELLIWANRWTESRIPKEKLLPEQLAELAAFRTEAEELIGK